MRCPAAAASHCAWAGARASCSEGRGRAGGAWPSRWRTPAWVSRRRTWIASSIRSSPPRRAGQGSGSRSPRRSSRTTAAPSTSAACRARARSSGSSCRSCGRWRWTRDMMTASDDAVPGRRELQGPTVLVLEEEAGVRELIVEILELHEFRVLPARDHGEAERVSAAHAGPLDLLITAAGPGAGRRLEFLWSARPETRVLYLSSWLEDAPPARIAGATPAKPFTVDGLVRKVWEVLGGATG